MKCRRGLWSPSRSQRLSGHNNHTFCHSIFLSAVFVAFLFLSPSLYHTFSDCLSSSQTLLRLLFPLYNLSSFQPPLSFFLPLPYSDFLSASSFPIYLAACHCISVSVGPLFFEVIIPHSGKHSYLHSCQNLEIDTALMSAC